MSPPTASAGRRLQSGTYVNTGDSTVSVSGTSGINVNTGDTQVSVGGGGINVNADGTSVNIGNTGTGMPTDAATLAATSTAQLVRAAVVPWFAWPSVPVFFMLAFSGAVSVPSSPTSGLVKAGAVSAIFASIIVIPFAFVFTIVGMLTMASGGMVQFALEAALQTPGSSYAAHTMLCTQQIGAIVSGIGWGTFFAGLFYIFASVAACGVASSGCAASKADPALLNQSGGAGGGSGGNRPVVMASPVTTPSAYGAGDDKKSYEMSDV
jgi:hypothetical protein